MLQFLNALPGRWLLWVHILEFGQLKETVKAKFSQSILQAWFLLLSIGIEELRFSNFFKLLPNPRVTHHCQRKESVCWNLEKCLSNLILDSVCSNSWHTCVLEYSLLPTEQTEFFFERKIIICCIFSLRIFVFDRCRISDEVLETWGLNSNKNNNNKIWAKLTLTFQPLSALLCNKHTTNHNKFIHLPRST